MTTSDLSVGQPFPVGVNYWPRRKAMYWWKDFERDEVAEEFDVIAGLGMRIVRMFLLWEDFQPTPEIVSPQALANLEIVADVAAERGLGLDVTFFTGHMSGPNWAPSWLLGGNERVPAGRQVVSGANQHAGPYRNPFSDPMAVSAAELLLREVVGRLRGHSGVWAWNLGNEPDNFALPLDDETGAAWCSRMFAVIREIDPQRHRTVGLHSPSLTTRNHLRADQVFADADFAVMHAYPIYANFGVGALDPDTVPFATALTAALSGRPVLMEEFGACTAPPGSDTVSWRWQTEYRDFDQIMLSEEALADHLAEVLPRLVEVGATGAMVWCYADYHESLWDRPPCDLQKHERHFGLVRPDGSLKPHAEVIREFIASGPVIGEPTARARMEVDGEAFYRDPTAALPDIYAAFQGGSMSEPQQMPSERPDLHVLDVPDFERYEARLGDERELAGLVDYRLTDDFIVLTHTEVLDGFEGQGIGSRLVRAVFEDLREREVAVIPKCPFVLAWLQKHPEQHDVLFRPLEAPEPDEPSPA